MIGVLGPLVVYERELIKERTGLKTEASRANGTRFGPPRKVNNTEHIPTAKRMKAGGHTVKYVGVTRAAVYRCVATKRRVAQRNTTTILEGHRRVEQLRGRNDRQSLLKCGVFRLLGASNGVQHVQHPGDNGAL